MCVASFHAIGSKKAKEMVQTEQQLREEVDPQHSACERYVVILYAGEAIPGKGIGADKGRA